MSIFNRFIILWNKILPRKRSNRRGSLFPLPLHEQCRMFLLLAWCLHRKQHILERKFYWKGKEWKVYWQIGIISNSYFITWRSWLLFLTYLWKSLTQYILLSKSMVNGTPSKHSLQTQHRKHPGWYVFPIAWSIWKLFNKCSIDEQKEITFYRFVIWYMRTSLYHMTVKIDK